MYAQKGYKVLLIDDDPQGSASQILGIDRNLGNMPEVNIDNLPKVAKDLEDENSPYEIDDLFGNPSDDELQESKYKGLHELINKAYYEIPITKKDIDEAIVSPTYRQELRKTNTTNDVKPRYKTVKFGFNLLPSSEELTDDELVISLDQAESRRATKGVILLKVIKAISYYADYDIILIDTGPSLGILTVNALAAATDGIIIAANIDEQSLWSLKKFKYNIRQIKEIIPNQEGILGVILGPCEPRNQLLPIVAYKIKKILKLYLFDTKIPRSVNASKATASGLLFAQIDDRAYEAFSKLADEILERRVENHNWEIKRNDYIKKEIEKLKEIPEHKNKTDKELTQVVRNILDTKKLWECPTSKGDN